MVLFHLVRNCSSVKLVMGGYTRRMICSPAVTGANDNFNGTVMDEPLWYMFPIKVPELTVMKISSLV